MKTWLKKRGGTVWGYRKEILSAGVAVFLIVGFFQLGRLLGGRETAFWRSIVTAPEPERCALCGSRERYHAPCIVKLATGEVGELRVYDPDLRREGELAPDQRTGTFSFLYCAGLVGYRDTSRCSSHVTLPEEREPIDPALFCRGCRTLLASTAAAGYLLLDLYEEDKITPYPITDGAQYTIRDYAVSISGREESGGLEVDVTGLLP